MSRQGYNPLSRRAGRTRRLRLTAAAFLLLFAALLGPSPAVADPLQRFLKKVTPSDLLPGAEAFGARVGEQAVVPLLKGGQKVGYGFLNSDFVNAAGYSGKPIHVMLGLDLEGRITGVVLVDHKEPIVLIGIPEKKIRDVIEGYIDLDVPAFARSATADRDVDIVSGATVTIMVIDDSVRRAALKVARRLRLGGLEPEVEASGPRWAINQDLKQISDWETLAGDGSVRRLRLSLADINAAFADSGDAVAAARPEQGDPQEDFIDLYTAVVSIPSVGVSLLGEAEYGNLLKTLSDGQAAIAVMAKGRYSFKGSGYVRGGIFDRFQVVQGDESLRFRDRDHKRLGEVAAQGAPDFKEVDLFYVPESLAFDAAQGWRLELLVARATGPTQKAFLTFDLTYAPPQKYLTEIAAPAPVAEGDAAGRSGQELLLWQRLWRDKLPEVVVLVAALGLLTGIFFVQDWLTKRPRLTEYLRVGFLIFTLFGLGFYANAQLSVVNAMAFFNALITGFRWEYFLMEPLIFILWSSVAVSMLFWGRGAFCGWLCPFGALQELLNRIAKRCKIPQIPVPWWLHQRLWPIKYILFLLLFGASLYSLDMAERLAEVEPFKTAIILKFQRGWPFVLFAVALLAIGLFIERFYCRYLCPLGAALAIPGRMRMFDWLKRYRECGSPCQRCAGECMVGAIHPEGHINPNECLSCLHCQTLYHDDRRCPVMIQQRLKRERRAALASQNLPPRGKAKPEKKDLELADFLPG